MAKRTKATADDGQGHVPEVDDDRGHPDPRPGGPRLQPGRDGLAERQAAEPRRARADASTVEMFKARGLPAADGPLAYDGAAGVPVGHPQQVRGETVLDRHRRESGGAPPNYGVIDIAGLMKKG